MNVRRKRIQQLVDDLLIRTKETNPPINVEAIIKELGIQVVRQKYPKDSDISGFVVRRDHVTAIGINSNHSPVRQRFTLAHELGHVLLHPPTTQELHIDRQFSVKFRDEKSSQGLDLEEREANLFAAELLMPRRCLLPELSQNDGIDLEGNTAIDAMAKRYDVSSQAFAIRLSTLGYGL